MAGPGMNQLFVYGTLMRGEERGFLAATARPATIQGQLWRAPAGYPALLLVDGGAEIAGEVVALDNPAITDSARPHRGHQ